MILFSPYVILPPLPPALLRAHDLAGVPSPAELRRREAALREATFPFPFFVPAASGGGGNDANTRILVHCDGADASTTFTNVGLGAPSSTVTTQGNAQVDTGITLSGFGQSVLAGASTDNLQIADAAANRPGTSDFIFDWWWYQTSTGIAGFGKTAGGTGPLLVYKNATTNIVDVYLGGSLVLTASDALSLNTWQHHAVVRSGTTFRYFRGGVQKASATDSTNISGTDPWNLLAPPGYGAGIIGNADEFRVVIGGTLPAAWINGFTPPSAPYS